MPKTFLKPLNQELLHLNGYKDMCTLLSSKVESAEISEHVQLNIAKIEVDLGELELNIRIPKSHIKSFHEKHLQLSNQ